MNDSFCIYSWICQQYSCKMHHMMFLVCQISISRIVWMTFMLYYLLNTKWSNINFTKYSRWSAYQFRRSNKTIERSNAIPFLKHFVSINTHSIDSNFRKFLFHFLFTLKKLLKMHVSEKGLKLLHNCCCENAIFSRVLIELLCECGFAYWHDVRHHTE